MTATTVAPARRFTRRQPCPVCAGAADLPQHQGRRCYGFVSEDGEYAHCTREECAGELPFTMGSATFAHRLSGQCRCGLAHGAQRTPETPHDHHDERDISLYACDLWRETRSADGTLVARYLASRGLDLEIPASLRHAPRLRHSPTGRSLPAMVAAVTRWPSTSPIAIHRTFLRADGSGKADVQPVRMSLGAVARGAVRLADPTNQLVIAEGIETALSVQQATGKPAWAALSASNMPGVILPALPLAKDVVIAADPDAAGLRAARTAAMRWMREGRTVRVAVPPAGYDFNDVLRVAG